MNIGRSKFNWSLVRGGALLLVLIARESSASATPPGNGANEPAYAESIRQAKRAMLIDPVRARRLGHLAGQQASGMAAGRDRDVAIATAQWIEGEGAYRSNAGAASAPLIAGALAIAQRVAPKSTLNADLLLARARILRESGEPQTALIDLQSAHNIFLRLNDRRGQAKALQSIGSIYEDALDYNHVLFYYQAAEDVYPSDLTLSISANNNIANALLHLGRLREAIGSYQRALQQAKRLKSLSLAANIYANMAQLSVENHDYDRAANLLSAGMKLTEQPSARNWRPLLLAIRAKLDLAQGNVSSAGQNISTALALASDAKGDLSSATIQLTAYQVYKALGDDRRALAHLETFRRMDEQGRMLAASTNAALMAAKFDFANQNTLIATLKAGQLSRDVALTRLQARQSTMIFSVLLIFLMTILILLFFYIRSVRRNRNEVVRTNAQLALTNAELGDALQAKSQFLATTSHEIRTPLNGILGMTQVMLADPAVGAGVRDRVLLVDSAGRAMRTLVDDILDFAKMDAGEIRVDSAAIQPTTLLPAMVALWQGQAEAKNIALRLDMDGVDAPLTTDAARLRQIMFNLLSNAIKFTTCGEVVVTARREEGRDRAMLAIGVSDTGIGIPSPAHEAIFEPFRQLDATTTRQFGGTGLGLAISRHLARVLGGDITVASGDGGSTFTLRLPYVAPAAGVDAEPPRRVTVAVASDNPIRRSFLRTALDRRFDSTAAVALSDLAAFLAAAGADIVVVDLEATATVAAAEIASSVRTAERSIFVLLVDESSPADLAKWQAAGASRVLVKPIRVELLAEQLSSIRHETAAVSAGDVTIPLA